MALPYRQGLLAADALVEVGTTRGLTAVSGGWHMGPADIRWVGFVEEQAACCTGHSWHKTHSIAAVGLHSDVALAAVTDHASAEDQYSRYSRGVS